MTLTYRDAPVSLDHSHWQLFAKRLRRRSGPFRFYMAGEYGEVHGRPHYHALLFGFRPADLFSAGRSPSGERLFGSDFLQDVWQRGHVSVGDVTFASAAYVARYVMKKVTGPGAAEHYGGRAPEYVRMSNGGRGGQRGIGFAWFDAFGRSDVAGDCRVLVNGHRCSPPRYYRKLLREIYPLSWAARAAARDQAAAEAVCDSAPERLEAKAKVLDARLGLLKRKI